MVKELFPKYRGSLIRYMYNFLSTSLEPSLNSKEKPLKHFEQVLFMKKASVI
jgi:hypothetical protein